MLALRDYQTRAVDDTDDAWRRSRNVLLSMPMGSGKTVTVSHIVNSAREPAAVMAHRQELVAQLSVALARYDVPHRIVGNDNVVRSIARLHVKACGVSYIHANAHVGVCGVQTLARRAKNLGRWLESVKLWVADEAHHYLADNTFGGCAQLFTNARGLGVTATPERADGKGLGRHAHGLFDELILGPTMRDLIGRGYLSDYRIFAPPSDLRMSGESLNRSGDWSAQQLKRAAKKSHIVGDVVAHYLRIAPGKRGLTFAPDIDTAGDIAARFRASGVPAEVVTAKTPDDVRFDLLRALESGRVLQLVNVDLFGEGTDIPAVEVCSMARPTESFALYCQQFGRPLRLHADKSDALIIDHVGNVVRHGLPDAPRAWSLDARESRGKSTNAGEKLKACPECTRVFDKFLAVCPHCGHKPEPAARSGPEFVDGDLTELDADTLARMRGEIERIDGPARLPTAAGPAAVAGARKNHNARQQAQAELREAIAQWAGYRKAEGRDHSYSYRRFYDEFGVDVMTAQTLGRPDAEALRRRILETFPCT